MPPTAFSSFIYMDTPCQVPPVGRYCSTMVGGRNVENIYLLKEHRVISLAAGIYGWEGYTLLSKDPGPARLDPTCPAPPAPHCPVPCVWNGASGRPLAKGWWCHSTPSSALWVPSSMLAAAIPFPVQGHLAVCPTRASRCISRGHFTGCPDTHLWLLRAVPPIRALFWGR